MPLFSSHAISPRWLRACLALLVLAFVLGTIAHAGHEHTRHDQTEHSHICDYCVGFAHLGASPANTVAIAAHVFFDEAPNQGVALIPYVAIHTVAQARAPPAR
jgi:hypothetical protein